MRRRDRALAPLLAILTSTGTGVANGADTTWWLSGQVNVIAQMHPNFRAAYTGDSSLRPRSEVASTRVVSVFAGFEASPRTEAWAVVESAGGSGLSHSLGVVGEPNADAVRSPELGPTPYVARLFLRHVWALTSASLPLERAPLTLHDQTPARRVDIVVGKFALPDFFDVNSVGSDDHSQFMNIAAVSNAAWQYAGDARGYTYGMRVEYADPSFAVRFAEALVPSVPNGTRFDWNVKDAHSENIELEARLPALADRPGAVRLLAFVNHANSGDYSEAIQSFRVGETPRPLIASTRRPGRRKYGIGANVEQSLTDELRVFARAGWSDARFEAYEVNQSAAAGADYLGTSWRRSADKTGLVVLSNGIARNVRDYLRLGGDGILLGDGSLRYGRETIIESYYDAQLAHGLSGAVDVQHIENPGYNRDRGPVWVFGLRLHLEL